MKIQDQINAAIGVAAANGGWLNWGDAAEWLGLQFKSGITAYLRGSSQLSDILDKKFGPPPTIETKNDAGEVIATSRGTRPDNAGWRAEHGGPGQVSVDVLRDAARASGYIELLRLIQNAQDEAEKFLGGAALVQAGNVAEAVPMASRPASSVPSVGTVSERNARWYEVFVQEQGNGPKHGAQARAIKAITARENVKSDTVKAGIQSAGKRANEKAREGPGPLADTLPNAASNPFNLSKPGQ